MKHELEPVGVMQILDTLDAGGMERVAVNLANHLPQGQWQSHLCTTRRDGPLAGQVLPQVQRVSLERRGRFDSGALRRLNAYIARHRIQVLHAHSTSVFLALLASCAGPRPRVIWHDHSGGFRELRRSVALYWLAARRLSGVLAVNQALAQWSRLKLRVPADRVWFVPNFVAAPAVLRPPPPLPGQAGARIVAVGNLRPAKDHLTLLAAMERVARAVPQAHLLLAGAEDPDEPAYVTQAREALRRPATAAHVTWLGPRDDVPAILAACDLGVLSSVYEGMPMALIEYGLAGLATVATRVGQCPEVLDEGRAGRLVPPGDADALAHALIGLLRSNEERRRLGQAFQQRVRSCYSADAVIGRITQAYDQILGRRIIATASVLAA